MPDTTRGFRSADQRWAAIKRTQRRMAPPPGGEDIGELVAQSLDAYWAQREAEVQAELEREAPAVFRRAAALFAPVGFWSDFALPVVPMALVLFTFLLARGGTGVALPDWLPWAGSAAAIGVGAIALLRYRRAAWLEDSVGALVAGLLLSTVVGLYLFLQTRTSTDLTLVALQEKIEDVAVASLRNKLDEGRYLQASVSDRFLSIETDLLSHSSAVYTASATSFPGRLVAEIGPRSGLVRWTTRNQEELRLALAAGEVIAAGQGTLLLRADRGDLQLKADPAVLGLRPAPGDCLVVAYDPAPEKCTIERAVRLQACTLGPLASTTPRPRSCDSN